MKKNILLTFMLILSAVLFMGCTNDDKIINYTLNDYNEIVVVYESGDYETIGTFDEVMNNAEYSIFPSNDGYYIINGVKSTIETRSYQINFESNCDCNVVSQNVKWRSKIQLPEIENPGYTLDGWYNGNKKWNFNVNIVEDNLLLKAKWIPNEYKINFQGTEAVDAFPVVIKTGEKYNLPYFNNKDLTFLGWSYEGKLLPMQGVYNFAKDINLTPVWSESEYAIHFNPDNGTTIDIMIVNQDELVYKLPIPFRFGYTFDGWYDGDELIKLPFKFVDKSLNLVAKWIKK